MVKASYRLDAQEEAWTLLAELRWVALDRCAGLPAH